jgi:hypothetical protein
MELTAASRTHKSVNGRCGSTRVLVFPHPYDSPPVPCEQRGCLTVAIGSPRELGGPPGCIRCRPHAVVWAAVPEASVDEYCNLGGPEDDIGPATWRLRQRCDIDSVPQAPAV